MKIIEILSKKILSGNLQLLPGAKFMSETGLVIDYFWADYKKMPKCDPVPDNFIEFVGAAKIRKVVLEHVRRISLDVAQDEIKVLGCLYDQGFRQCLESADFDKLGINPNTPQAVTHKSRWANNPPNHRSFGVSRSYTAH